MNSSQNKNSYDVASAELDQLVLSEIQAFQREWSRKHHARHFAPDYLDPDAGESEPRQAEARREEEGAKKLSWENRFQCTENQESLDKEHNELSPGEVLSGRPDEGEAGPKSGFGVESTEALFSEEEEGFIQNAVGWLSARHNKDAIVDRIWVLLNESDPQTFYSPSPESFDSLEETSANGTADGDQNGSRSRD